MEVVNIRGQELCVRMIGQYRTEYQPVYIGRENSRCIRSQWANIFKMNSESERGDVIMKYSDYLNTSELIYQIYKLLGLTLGCWCKPKACHGDLLVHYANSIYACQIGETTVSASLSYISGIRAFELYLALLGVTMVPIQCKMFPPMILNQKDSLFTCRYSTLRSSYIVEANERPLNHPITYLFIRSSHTIMIEVLANSFDEYGHGFQYLSKLTEVPLPEVWKVEYSQRLSVNDNIPFLVCQRLC